MAVGLGSLLLVAAPVVPSPVAVALAVAVAVTIVVALRFVPAAASVVVAGAVALPLISVAPPLAVGVVVAVVAPAAAPLGLFVAHSGAQRRAEIYLRTRRQLLAVRRRMESLLSAALAELDADDEGEQPVVVAAKAAEPVSAAPTGIAAGALAEQTAKAATTGTPPAGSEGDSADQPGGGRSGCTAAASSSSSVAGRPKDDDFEGMEETLAALARSAETLASMGGESEGDESTAMLEMLAKQLKEIGIGEGFDDDMGLEGLFGGAGENGAEGRRAAAAGGSGQSDGAIDGLLDGLVGQLLSKEVMLEPMQTLHAEFPRFLSEKGGSLSAADKSRYERQQLIVAQIVAAYEHTPNDTDKVAQLMQEMQACGPPPSELAAPGMPGTDACCIS